MNPVPPPHDWHAPIIAGIVQAYARYRQPVYIEVGVDRGHTLRAIAPLVREAHAVDVTFEHAGELPKNVLRWECSSDEFWFSHGQTAWNFEKADVVFIDGDHDGVQVCKDLSNALAQIKPDGTIILHDTHPEDHQWDDWCADAWRARKSAEDDPSLASWTLPLFPGLTFVSRRLAPYA